MSAHAFRLIGFPSEFGTRILWCCHCGALRTEGPKGVRYAIPLPSPPAADAPPLTLEPDCRSRR